MQTSLLGADFVFPKSAGDQQGSPRARKDQQRSLRVHWGRRKASKDGDRARQDRKGVKGELARSGKEVRRTPIVHWGQGKACWRRKGVRTVGTQKPTRANAQKSSFVRASKRAICQASVGTLQARKMARAANAGRGRDGGRAGQGRGGQGRGTSGTIPRKASEVGA
jgi:hypothetical protein